MTFQMYVNITMMKTYRIKTYRPIKLIERSLLSARCISRSNLKRHSHFLNEFSRHCFVESMRFTGTLDPAMASVLDEWYEYTDTDYRTRPHAVPHQKWHMDEC